ncbi:hypothetical protein NBRC116494_08450 [Aurantivibrio plasticivorans]
MSRVLDQSDAIYGTWNEKDGWKYHNIKGFLDLGYSAETLTLDKILESNPMHEADWNAVLSAFYDCAKTGKEYQHDYRAIGLNGDVAWYRNNVKAARKHEGGNTYELTAISRNITELKQAENQIIHHAQQEQWLVQITNDIFDCSDFASLQKILARFGEHLKLDRCTLRLTDPATGFFNMVSEWHRPGLEPLAKLFPDLISQLGTGWLDRLTSWGDTYAINTLEDQPSKSVTAYYRKIDIDAYATQPIFQNNQVIGLFNILSTEKRIWTKEEIRLLRILTDNIHMAVLRNRILNELRANEDRFNLAMQTSTHGLWDYNTETQHIYLSEHYYSALGYEQGEIEPTIQAMIELTHPDDRDYFTSQIYSNKQNSQGMVNIELRQKKKDGSYVWMLSKGKVVKRDASGKALRIMGVNLDISSLKAKLDHLKSIRKEAELANNSKSEFLERMSHEIRTPMNAITGMCYLALQDKLTTEQRGFLNDIESAAHSLLRIIDDILDFSKIESGTLDLVHENFSLYKELKSIIKLVAAKAEKNHNELSLNIGDNVPNNVIGDRHRLGQVITNLLSNAVKFTENGNISVSAQLADLDSRTNSVSILFSVSDSGIGLTDEALEKLFEPFIQAADSTTRKYGGTGLGLSICKNLVEMMGGSIQAISLPDVGTTFHFTIVFKQSPTLEDVNPHEKRYRAEPITHEIPLTLKTVLLVEDNIINQRVAQGMLNKFGINVITANNGQEALYMLKASSTEEISAILMDIEMPVLNGLETTKKIRASDENWRNIPIIAMTAHAMVGDKERCLSFGMNDHIAKPVDPEKLISTLSRIVSHK